MSLLCCLPYQNSTLRRHIESAVYLLRLDNVGEGLGVNFFDALDYLIRLITADYRIKNVLFMAGQIISVLLAKVIS